MTSKLTRERIELIANFHRAMALPPSHAEIEELARMALAAMDSEPVAEVLSNRPGNDTSTIDRALPVGTQLYRHAQQAPVAPAVSDDIGEIRVGRLPTMNQDDYPGLGDWWVQLRIGEDSDEVLARVYGATPQEANNRAEALACRAAMLHAGNSPAQSDCCPAQNSVVPAQSGSSPAIPDGYVLVPKEATKEILDEFDSIIDYGAEDSVDAWHRLLAAATQEVKP